MKLTVNDIAVLSALCRYYLLSASMIHGIVFPNNSDRRTTRRRLQRLVNEKYISRSTVNVAFSTGNAGPCYYLTDKGANALAVYYDDAAYLVANVKPPRNDRLYHWLDIAHAHWMLRQACELAQGVELVGWINEWQELLDAQGNASGYVLHTQFREGPKPLSCSPDAAFMLNVAGFRRVHFVEVDRGTTGAKRVAASKMPGYSELLRIKGHRRHFPETTFDDFAVLIIAPSASRRNILRSCIASQTDFNPELWLCIAASDFTPERALFQPIAFDCDGEPGAIVSPGVASELTQQQGEAVDVRS